MYGEKDLQKALIFGYGISGQAVEAFLQQKGISFILCDEKLGKKPQLSDFKDQPWVIFSPGFRWSHPWLLQARAAGCFCLNELDFASLYWPGRIIAITGTNGKSTLTDLLTQAYRNLGIPTYPGGNYGQSLLTPMLTSNITANTLAVVEVSSFQAEHLVHFQPEALLWTNFSEDHLDRHLDLQTYFAAKWNLVQRLTHMGSFWAGPTVYEHAQLYDYTWPKQAHVVGINIDIELPEGTIFDHPPQCDNYRLAAAYWQAQGLPEQALIQAAVDLPLSEHRLYDLGKVQGVRFWNDSKATNFDAALAAIATMKGPVHWIGGGFSKGGDIICFGHRVAQKVRKAYLIGDTAALLAPCFHPDQAFICKNLKDAVIRAFQQAEPGDVILLAPGFASFGLFQNYIERGHAFQTAIADLNSLLK